MYQSHSSRFITYFSLPFWMAATILEEPHGMGEPIRTHKCHRTAPINSYIMNMLNAVATSHGDMYASFELFTQTCNIRCDNLSLLPVRSGAGNDSSIRISVCRLPSILSSWRAYYVFDISALLALTQRNEKHQLHRTNRTRLRHPSRRKIFVEWELITWRVLFRLLREEIHHWVRAHSWDFFLMRIRCIFLPGNGSADQIVSLT